MPTIICKGLLFDMDGVLVDSTPAVARVWTRWAIKHNLDPDHAVMAAHGRTSLTSIQELLPDADPAIHLAENDWMERAEIEDIDDIIALPGAKELLGAIPNSQFAIVTSATRALAEVRLRAAGVWQYIQHLVTASDIQRSKPDPEPYLTGAAALQLHPQLCVVLEDAPSGIRSGKSAGARALALRTTSRDNELLAAGADWIANDCASLHIATSAKPGYLALYLPAHEIPQLPKMR